MNEQTEQYQRDGRRFYRLFLGSDLTRDAFLSDQMSGVRERPRDPGKVKYWEGFSVFETLAQARLLAAERKARARAKGIAWPDESVAEMTIWPDSRITYERSFRSEGHYTVWGDPDECLRCVTWVFPAQSQHEG